MKVGKALYFMQDDSGSSGGVVYQLRVLEFHPTRLVVEFENVSPIRRFFITLFHPGDLQFVYFLEARSPGLWGLYSLLRTGRDASSLSSGHQASYVNRVIAFFRHFAGHPNESESRGKCGTERLSTTASQSCSHLSLGAYAAF
jgi:hypothetical protein